MTNLIVIRISDGKVLADEDVPDGTYEEGICPCNHPDFDHENNDMILKNHWFEPLISQADWYYDYDNDEFIIG